MASSQVVVSPTEKLYTLSNQPVQIIKLTREDTRIRIQIAGEEFLLTLEDRRMVYEHLEGNEWITIGEYDFRITMKRPLRQLVVPEQLYLTESGWLFPIAIGDRIVMVTIDGKPEEDFKTSKEVLVYQEQNPIVWIDPAEIRAWMASIPENDIGITRAQTPSGQFIIEIFTDHVRVSNGSNRYLHKTISIPLQSFQKRNGGWTYQVEGFIISLVDKAFSGGSVEALDGDEFELGTSATLTIEYRDYIVVMRVAEGYFTYTIQLIQEADRDLQPSGRLLSIHRLRLSDANPAGREFVNELEVYSGEEGNGWRINLAPGEDPGFFVYIINQADLIARENKDMREPIVSVSQASFTPANARSQLVSLSPLTSAVKLQLFDQEEKEVLNSFVSSLNHAQIGEVERLLRVHREELADKKRIMEIFNSSQNSIKLANMALGRSLIGKLIKTTLLLIFEAKPSIIQIIMSAIELEDGSLDRVGVQVIFSRDGSEKNEITRKYLFLGLFPGVPITPQLERQERPEHTRLAREFGRNASDISAVLRLIYQHRNELPF